MDTSCITWLDLADVKTSKSMYRIFANGETMQQTSRRDVVQSVHQRACVSAGTGVDTYVRALKEVHYFLCLQRAVG